MSVYTVTLNLSLICLSGDELTYITFLGFLDEQEEKKEEEEEEIEDEEDDEDEYGIKEQLKNYVGIRLCGKKKAVISVDQVQVDTWVVVVADSSSDAFYLDGSDTPLWLAYVEDKVEEENGDKTLVFRWWVPMTVKNAANKPNAAKSTFLKVSGENGLDKMKGLDHKQLVHINIKTLNGLNGRNRTKGKLPKAVLKGLANVLLPSEADKIRRICPSCKSGCSSGKEGEPIVECAVCNQFYHLQCLSSVEGDADEWVCELCNVDDV